MYGSLLHDLFFNAEAACMALNVATLLAPLYAFILHPLYYWLFKDALEAMDQAHAEETDDGECSEEAEAEEEECTPGRLSSRNSGTRHTRGSAQVRSPFTPTTTEAILRATRGSSLGSGHNNNEEEEEEETRHLFLANSLSPSHPRYSTASPCRDEDDKNTNGEAENGGRKEGSGGHEVLKVESRVRRLFSRCVRRRAYDQSGCTREALRTLYTRPAFQRWYCAQRACLLDRVKMREQTALWRHLSMLTMLLIGLCALPAFSFANTGTAASGLWPTLRSLRARLPFLGAASNAQQEYSIAQLLCSRVQYVRNGERDQARRWLSLFGLHHWPPASHPGLELMCAIMNVLINEGETLLILTALCLLLTSVWMRRDCARVATLTLVSYLFLIAECVMVPRVTLRLGMGFLVTLGIVLARLMQSSQ